VTTFAVAVTVVTDTNAIVVLKVPTDAGIVRASVLHMTVAHVKERPDASKILEKSNDGLDLLRLQSI
jgi:hypothetical protein